MEIFSIIVIHVLLLRKPWPLASSPWRRSDPAMHRYIFLSPQTYCRGLWVEPVLHSWLSHTWMNSFPLSTCSVLTKKHDLCRNAIHKYLPPFCLINKARTVFCAAPSFFQIAGILRMSPSTDFPHCTHRLTFFNVVLFFHSKLIWSSSLWLFFGVVF